MNKFRLSIKLMAIAIFMFAFASMAQAQATRTWVSGVGDDVNPCSRTAPCKTFAGAISKTAANGEIDALDPGGFGTVTITKSITIDGTHGAGFGSILAAGTNGVNVNDSATGSPGTIIVSLRSLSIQGAGTGFVGINYTSGLAVHVEDCIIANFRGNGTNSHGINMNLTLGGKSLTVRDSIIRDNSGSGIRSNTTVFGNSVVVENCTFERNQNGIFAENNSNLTVVDSTLALNVGAGITIAGTVSANLDNNKMELNATGLQLGSVTGTVRISDNTIAQNSSNGIQCAPSSPSSYGENRVKGNGTDLNGCTVPLPPLGKN